MLNLFTRRRSDVEQRTADEVREIASNTVGLQPHDVQIRGGLAVARGRVAEMETGEGKTLTAVLPACLHARLGRPVLIATANDYLAARDAEWMRPLYTGLGLGVAAITAGLPRTERQRIYQHDVVYGTAREFGFDFLRDQLEERRRQQGQAAQFSGGPGKVQREPGFLLLDEADSLMIDEARTPLLISGPTGPTDSPHETCYGWAAQAAPLLQEARDFVRQGPAGWPALTPIGRQQIRNYAMPGELDRFSLTELHHAVERAVFVRLRYRRDQHFVIRDQQVQIVDEFTGRIQTGRQWNDGIHQAVEAAHGVPFTPETGCLAQVTLQGFIRRFPYLGGMTGTAREAAREFRSIYGMTVDRIPTHRPLQRAALPALVCRSVEDKWAAIAQETMSMQQAGRAVLIGTQTIEMSTSIAAVLQQAGLSPTVLNALNPQEEAAVVALAGAAGRVTVATNMAGRGTDIRLADSVRERGGLHVICSETHLSGRIDRQLTGRCGRQGDPGSFRHFHSLDDTLLSAAFGAEWVEQRRRSWIGSNPSIGLPQFRRAQRSIERRHLLERLELDDRDRARCAASLALGLDPVLDAIS